MFLELALILAYCCCFRTTIRKDDEILNFILEWCRMERYTQIYFYKYIKCNFIHFHGERRKKYINKVFCYGDKKMTIALWVNNSHEWIAVDLIISIFIWKNWPLWFQYVADMELVCVFFADSWMKLGVCWYMDVTCFFYVGWAYCRWSLIFEVMKLL